MNNSTMNGIRMQISVVCLHEHQPHQHTKTQRPGFEILPFREMFQKMNFNDPLRWRLRDSHHLHEYVTRRIS